MTKEEQRNEFEKKEWPHNKYKKNKEVRGKYFLYPLPRLYTILRIKKELLASTHSPSTCMACVDLHICIRDAVPVAISPHLWRGSQDTRIRPCCCEFYSHFGWIIWIEQQPSTSCKLTGTTTNKVIPTYRRTHHALEDSAEGGYKKNPQHDESSGPNHREQAL